jgi:hypothetical protein
MTCGILVIMQPSTENPRQHGQDPEGCECDVGSGGKRESAGVWEFEEYLIMKNSPLVVLRGSGWMMRS